MSYFRLIGNPEANMSQFYLVLPLIVIISIVVFPIGMEMAKKVGARLTVSLGATITILSTFASSFATTPVLFFALYAIGFGIGKGFLYPAPLNAGWSHLEERKGLVSGIIVSGLGIGAFSFGLIVSFVVNPDNAKAEMVEVLPGVHEAYFSSEIS